MTSKNSRSTFSKGKKHQSAKPRHKKWLVAILLLPILIIGYLFWSQPSSDTTVAPMVAPPTITQQSDAARSADPSTEPSAEDAIIESDTKSDNDAINDSSNDSIVDENLSASKDNATENKSNVAIPSSKAITDAPIPETDTLAKEEIDRLADEHQRLKEQENIDAEQIEMTKSLTQMKAQQIELLERQIAELEAEQAAQ
ncbi:hypothetical protein [uncultured Psychrobacter sp.]|uniref:hypothetical protein n=1 Tax=uncultured Psychrobacter sp. TaxID=259303 RepID=UPI002614E575|nr:hypothetical protein [uncultured Psychrobacter sp.]